MQLSCVFEKKSRVLSSFLCHDCRHHNLYFKNYIIQFAIVLILFVSFIRQALSRAVTEDELIYIRAQYNLLEPNSRDGRICTDNFRLVSANK